MSENCGHDCANCAENCDHRESFLEAPNPGSHIKKVIGVVSGKGGVGKSLVTSLLAAGMLKRGKEVAVLDADITGPSIPKMFGVAGQTFATDEGIVPAYSSKGTKLMSLNLVVDNPTDPVVWRGPIIAGIVKQFWTDVNWGDVDYMFVDMPPGTGDVPLTVFQSLPVDGIVVVSSPQELVGMIVEKAVKMAGMMNIPVLGLVENMSYFECPDCGSKHYIFGESKVDGLAAQYGIKNVSKLPIDPKFAKAADEGLIEHVEGEYLAEILGALETL